MKARTKVKVRMKVKAKVRAECVDNLLFRCELSPATL